MPKPHEKTALKVGCGELKEPVQRHFVVQHRLGESRFQTEISVQRPKTLGANPVVGVETVCASTPEEWFATAVYPAGEVMLSETGLAASMASTYFGSGRYGRSQDSLSSPP